MKQQKNTKKEEISRKEALKKIGKYGKYAALTAIGTYTILSPKKAQASSPEDPGTGFRVNSGALEISSFCVFFCCFMGLKISSIE